MQRLRAKAPCEGSVRRLHERGSLHTAAARATALASSLGRQPRARAPLTPAARRIPWWRARIFWAKFWLVATGVWWGICMQLIYYEGAGHPLSLLPNITWYVGMMAVDFGNLCRPRSARYARVRQVHMLPIGLCDFLGTVGTTVGLVRCGSAIFGIIYSSVTVWAALFSCCILNKSQSSLRVAGILAVVVGLVLPTIEQASRAPHSHIETASKQRRNSEREVGALHASGHNR